MCFPLSICVCVYLHSFLTTATQPRAGMLSLTADRWLKRLLPRFRSRKLWILWMWSEIGFSRSCNSACTGRTRESLERAEGCRRRCQRERSGRDERKRWSGGKLGLNNTADLNQITKSPGNKNTSWITSLAKHNGLFLLQHSLDALVFTTPTLFPLPTIRRRVSVIPELDYRTATDFISRSVFPLDLPGLSYSIARLPAPSCPPRRLVPETFLAWWGDPSGLVRHTAPPVFTVYLSHMHPHT